MKGYCCLNKLKIIPMDLATEEVGLRGAELLVEGQFAFGLLKSERGTHRLVRISPYNNHKRQTSFAAVEVWPLLEDLRGSQYDNIPERVRLCFALHDTITMSGSRYYYDAIRGSWRSKC